MPLKPGMPVADAIHELSHFGSRPRSHEQIVAIAESNFHRKAKRKRKRGGGIKRDGDDDDDIDAEADDDSDDNPLAPYGDNSFNKIAGPPRKPVKTGIVRAARGRGIARRADGGDLITDIGADPTVAAPLTQTRAASLNPMQRGYVGQYDQMPDEKLQEMALRYSGSPQGETAQRILMARRMGQAQRPVAQAPTDDQSGINLPEPVRTAPINLQQQGGMRRGGGIAQRAGGGQTSDDDADKSAPIDTSIPIRGAISDGGRGIAASRMGPGNLARAWRRHGPAIKEDVRGLFAPVRGLGDVASSLGDVHWGDDLGEGASRIGRNVYGALVPRAAAALSAAGDLASHGAALYAPLTKDIDQRFLGWLNNKNQRPGYRPGQQPGPTYTTDTLPGLHTGKAFRGYEMAGGNDLESPEPWTTPAWKADDAKQAKYLNNLSEADANRPFSRFMKDFLLGSEGYGQPTDDSAGATNMGLNLKYDRAPQLHDLGIYDDQHLMSDLTPRMAKAAYWDKYKHLIQPGMSDRDVDETLNLAILSGVEEPGVTHGEAQRILNSKPYARAHPGVYDRRMANLANFENYGAEVPLDPRNARLGGPDEPVQPQIPNQHIPLDVTNSENQTGYLAGLDEHAPLPPSTKPVADPNDLPQDSTSGTGGLRISDLLGDTAGVIYDRLVNGPHKAKPPMRELPGPVRQPTVIVKGKGQAPGVVAVPNLGAIAGGDDDWTEEPMPQRRRGGGITKLAMGGDPMGISGSAASPWWERAEQRNESGFLRGSTPGRADKLTTTSPAGAYIIPADVVAGLGEGNSLAGAAIMDRILESGPWGIHVNRFGRSGPPEAHAPMPRQYDDGGEDYSGGESDRGGYARGGRLHRDAGGSTNPTQRSPWDTTPDSPAVDTSQVSSPGLLSFMGPSASWGNQIGSAIAGQLIPGGGLLYDAAASALPGLTQMGPNTQVNSATPDHSTWLGKLWGTVSDFGNQVGSAIGSSPAVGQDANAAMSQGKTGANPPAAAAPPPPAPSNFIPQANAASSASSVFGGPNTGDTNAAQSHGVAFDSTGWNNANPTIGQSGSGGGGGDSGRFDVSGGWSGEGGGGGATRILGTQQAMKTVARGGGIGFARGGRGIVARPRKQASERIPVALSHGEYQVDPADVAKIGKGNVKLGHAILDHFVQKARGEQIKKLTKLKPPVGAKKAA